MACGLAMVCADAPNTRALMRHDDNAKLCADQPGAYAQALTQLIVDGDLRRRLANRALKRSAAFRWTQILDEVAEVYGEALRARSMEQALPPARRRAPSVEPATAGLPAL